MRSVVVLVVVLAACITPDLNTICPSKTITQGVFGEIVDSTNTLEQGVEVDINTELNGAIDHEFGSAATTRGGYQFEAGPSTYFVCAKNTCGMVTVPTGGVVEFSGSDNGTTVTWGSAVAVPPEQKIGPCTWD
jgi:hypothetical protein